MPVEPGGGADAATWPRARSGLGLSTIALYALVYTPLKRKHVSNTWVGAVAHPGRQAPTRGQI